MAIDLLNHPYMLVVVSLPIQQGTEVVEELMAALLVAHAQQL
jgi:hypothetical protein